MNDSVENADGVTGRDKYIIGQALVYAIAYIQSLPREQQEPSSALDMFTLLVQGTNAAMIETHARTVREYHGKVLEWPKNEESSVKDKTWFDRWPPNKDAAE